ncbi:DUF1853 family protein [Vibrio coralliilyticus]|uniref:DUF1853 family protein n=1 Tax=Vibrio coralliilyticus TaxID=190893 RepID=UPI000C16E6CD|nr:DUF1853 family protein [Vibrio coralliilyticus]NRF15698.1 DUF1853 family protein [Vibrio coralliilyticus]
MNQLQRFYHWIASSPSLFTLTPPFESLQTLPVHPLSDPNYHGNPRLGFLYQHLCTELLVNSGRYSVELEEVQIHRENGQTLGAIDLILKNESSNQLEHWEVAIKFYLLHQGIWYGPNAHDQLDKKLDRMLSHQLKMSSSTQFSSKYPELDNLTEHLLLQGRLYINPFSTEPIPTHCLGYEIDTTQISGLWCYESQWELIDEPLYQLDKPFWATGRQDFEQPITKPDGRFVHAQTEQGQFWFVVPDHWPNG